MQSRKELNTLLADEGIKLSVNDFIIKAAALALRKYPNLNASLGDGEVIQHGHINIGVAVAVEGGLLTVVTHDADAKPLRVISQEIREKAGRVREGKVQPDDVSGSTFTTSNLGMYGVSSFTAMVTPPQIMVLSVGAVRRIPVFNEADEVVARSMMTLTLGSDHRVVNGAQAASFLATIRSELEAAS